jgi:hypothetical protein
MNAARALVAIALVAGVTLAALIASPGAAERGRAAAAPAAAAGTTSPVLIRRVLALTASAPGVGYRVRFSGPRPGVRAQADTRRMQIDVFVRSRDATHRIAHDLAHELGHALDDRRLSSAERAAYLRRRGVPEAAWWPGGARSDLATGAGDFAEVFARCHAPSPDFRSRLAPAPADACAMLPREARPR